MRCPSARLGTDEEAAMAKQQRARKKGQVKVKLGLLATAGFAALFAPGAARQQPASPGRGASPSRDTAYQRQRSPGPVTLDLEPIWNGRDGLLVVAIRARSHSVDLSTVDLARQVRLLVEGRSIPPIHAGSLMGHYAHATVSFRVTARPERFRIALRGLPEVQVRVLSWPPLPAPAPSRRPHRRAARAASGESRPINRGGKLRCLQERFAWR